jgi:Uma2 family endonuclease
MPKWDLEYMLLFGPPENKLELLGGQTPCSFPFLSRELADEHFAAWAQTLSRWQGIADPPACVKDDALVKAFGKFALKQYLRPIRLEVPSAIEGYHWANHCFWDRGLWPMQPGGFETGCDSTQEPWRIKINLWNTFREAQKRLGFDGDGIGGVDISLTDTDAVQPDFFWFRGAREQYMIGRHYFKGVPQLIMEVLSPFSRAIDRGPRKDVYRRAGVEQLWLIEPLTRTIELHRLVNGEYHLTATAREGEALEVPGLEGLTIEANRVFETHSSDLWGQSTTDDKPAKWAIPPDVVVGLQHLILLGHAERRREIWNNQSPCFLAFGSAEEARHRLDRFVLEASQWENAGSPAAAEIEPDVDVADVGRFHFVRRRNIVRLNIDVNALLYRELLEVTANRDAWDWGDEMRIE